MDREACVLWTPKPLGHKESDMTEWLNWTEFLNKGIINLFNHYTHTHIY